MSYFDDSRVIQAVTSASAAAEAAAAAAEAAAIAAANALHVSDQTTAVIVGGYDNIPLAVDPTAAFYLTLHPYTDALGVIHPAGFYREVNGVATFVGINYGV